MRPWKKMVVHVAWSGLFISGFPGTILPLAAQQSVMQVKHEELASATSSQPLLARASEQLVLSELPDSPGAIVSKSAESALAAARPGSGTSDRPPHPRKLSRPLISHSPRGRSRWARQRRRRPMQAVLRRRNRRRRDCARKTAAHPHDYSENGSDYRSRCGCGLGGRTDFGYFE